MRTSELRIEQHDTLDLEPALAHRSKRTRSRPSSLSRRDINAMATKADNRGAKVERSDEQRRLLFDMDYHLRRLRTAIGDADPAVVGLTGTNHNLLRLWADV